MSGTIPDDPSGSTLDLPKPSAARPALERGARVGRFMIVDPLGSGGMGVVYKAFDPELDRTVALKLLKTAEGDGGVLRDRLLKEAQALARLPHPNVVAVHDVGTFGADVFVAMEFVEGQTLRAWLEKAPRRRREILDAFVAAGQGLVAAHRAGLVHRDFKPDNVIVGSDGRVRVLDFGLATAPKDRADGAVVGTPRFMAPEQYLAQEVDERADQFSFCVSLYFALYREFPFAGSTSWQYQENLVAGRVQEPPHGTGMPRWLRQVLLRGLSARPEARWPSMQELLSQLSRDPQRTLRRALYAGAAALGVAALTFGTLRMQARQLQLCAGAEGELRGTWDGSRHETVRRAFLGTGKSFAEDAFNRVSTTLDAYAQNWAKMRTSACQATRVRGEQSEELLDLRMECLDQRARELRALTELFASADAALVQRSIDAVQGLTSLDECANAATLKAPVRLPSDPAARAHVEALRERIARGQALWQASLDQQGIAWMKSVVEEASALPHPPTQAQALSLYGSFQWRAAELPAAEATLKQALLAAESGRDDETAAKVCIRLIRTLLDLRPNSPEMLQWGEHAKVWVARLAGSSPAVEAELAATLGAIHRERGEFSEAMRDYQRELEVAERGFGRESAQTGKALSDLSIAFYDLEQYEQSIVYSERGLAVDEKVLGPQHPGVGETLSNLSQSYNELGRLDDSVRVLERADRILRPVAAPGNPWLGVVQVNLGGTYDSQGRYEEALAVFRAALAEQKAPDVVAALTSGIGSVLCHQRKFAEALPFHEKALALNESVFGSDHPIVAGPLLGIGLDRLGLGQPAKAVAPLERAARLAHQQRWQRGAVRLALAHALDGSRRGDLARVRALMIQARDDLGPMTHVNAKELSEIDAWLARHPE
jgi:tetratricopeptide (TPR) repeat protein/predicted Ser/Thr protein kinase